VTRKLIAVFVLIAVVGLAAFVIASKSRPPEARFATVTRETVVDTVMTNGKAEPIEWAAIHTEQSGPLVRLSVQRGQRVAAGAVIAEVSASGAREDLAAAEARIEQARAELTLAESGGRASDVAEIEGSLRKAKLELASAQRDMESLQRLVDKKAATLTELHSAKDRVSQAQAQVQSLQQRRGSLVAKTDRTVAEARLRDAQAAADAAKKRIAQGTIRAPMAGVVYDLNVRRGDFVNVGDRIASVGNVERMKVIVYVDEPELGRVRAGMPVVVTWDARPGKEWKGTVEKIPTEITALGTRQVGEVACTVENPDQELLPGTNVNAAIRSNVVENALTIPKECLRRENGQTGVLVLDGERLAWRPVKTGIWSITRTQVVEGLKDGDRVLVPGERQFKSGDAVRAGA
jgi:HlyD family secretion protein